MALEQAHFCPVCDAERTFRRTASMHLHLGLKAKWTCAECSFKIVTVDGEIDTAG